MAREFGFKYQDKIGGDLHLESGCDFYHYKPYQLYPLDDFYIHPDSYGIFEPKEGDWRASKDLTEIYYHKGELDKDAYPKCTEIIMRDGKHFFMPKEANNA